MTGLVRKATLMAVCGLLAASAAMAGVPSAANSAIPRGFSLVGETVGATDPNGLFTIGPIRDFAGNPIWNSTVAIDFTGCCDDIRISENQFYPGMFRFGKTIRAITDAAGIATFDIMGAAMASDPTPAAGCAKVYADGVFMTDGFSHMPCQVSAYDLNGAVGAPGLGAGDLAVWLSDFFSSPLPYRARSDYDYPVFGVQSIGASDLARWLMVYFASGSTSNGPTFVPCP